jgi:haloacetate dehalogenase
MRSATALDALRDFSAVEIPTEEASIFARVGGSGPPLLLLHGFPETHLMWRDVAPQLAREFSVVCADLRGYGRSGCPPSDPHHEPYAKRAMARDMVSIMAQLGFRHFSVAGHDRGGRVAYRLALDHPDRIDGLAVMDIVPTETAWAEADDRLALGYWPWSLLAQPEPLPEQVLVAAAEAVVNEALGGWGSPASAFPEPVRSAYTEALQAPGHAHAVCEEYRAAAALDREHDRADQSSGRRIGCPVLVLWSGKGPLATWYAELGGPLGVWRQWGDRVEGQAMDGGHFFPEELPEQTAELLSRFCAKTSNQAAAAH